jgi:FixJ family two-component response regulator
LGWSPASGSKAWVTVSALLITGSPSVAFVAKAAQLGVEKVLEKPPTETELLGFIEAHR